MKTMKLVMASAIFGMTIGIAKAADTFPSRPITIIVPYSAGGTSDVQARMISTPLAKILGQPVIIDNRPGAAGAIGTQIVARAKPDGYTLLYPNIGFLIAPLLNKNVQYDPIKDFAAITSVSSVPMVLVTNKSVPAKNLSEFLEYAKKQPQKIQYASAGIGSYGHLSTEYLAQLAGFNVEHIPYKGEAGTTMAVSTGEVPMLLTSPSSAMFGLIEQGALTLLGVGSAAPSSTIPGVPPISTVVPEFVAEIWFGLVAPAGTPDAVIQKINSAMTTILTDKDIHAKMLPTGAIPASSTPTAFQERLTNEHSQLQELITQINITTN